MAKKISKKYADALRESDEFIKNIRAAIMTDAPDGEVPPEWESQLRQLRDLYFAYLKAYENQVNENPVILINGGKTQAVNFSLSVMMKLARTMDQIIRQFGLSPLAKKRLKSRPEKPAEEPDFLDTLKS